MAHSCQQQIQFNGIARRSLSTDVAAVVVCRKCNEAKVITKSARGKSRIQGLIKPNYVAYNPINLGTVQVAL